MVTTLLTAQLAGSIPTGSWLKPMPTGQHARGDASRSSSACSNAYGRTARTWAATRRATTAPAAILAANLVSWLIVNAVVYLLSQVFGGLGVLTGDGLIAEVYLTLIATTPLTGRALLWVLAPSALAVPRQPEPA